MQASLNNWRGSPRKFNEYLRAVRGLKALEAADRLKFLTSPYAEALRKLILSAVANASDDPAVVPANLILSEATVGRAMFFKRVCFRGRGRTGRVTRFGSNVHVKLRDANIAEALKETTKKVMMRPTLKKELQISEKDKKELIASEKKPVAKKSSSAKADTKKGKSK